MQLDLGFSRNARFFLNFLRALVLFFLLGMPHGKKKNDSESLLMKAD